MSMSGLAFELIDPLLVLLVLLDLRLLGTSRMAALIQGAALQGLILGAMPLLMHPHAGARVALLALGAVLIKSVVIPRMLHRALRQARIRREVEPFVGYMPSLLLGALGTGLALLFARTLPLLPAHQSLLVVPASLATVFTGFLILISRLKAITQVVGYLVLENGIFIFGLLLLEAMPFLVEIGVLLDLLVGVFVMGIIINHINRTFASLDTRALSALKE